MRARSIGAVERVDKDGEFLIVSLILTERDNVDVDLLRVIT